MPAGLSDYNAQSFSGLNANMNMRSVRERLSIDKARERIISYLQEDKSALKLAGNRQKSSDSRDLYRARVDEFTEKIRKYFVANGIEVYRDVNGKAVPCSLDEISRQFAADRVGFSVLESAINDPDVTDIYCIGHNRIFVEKNGVNEEYPFYFRNPKDFEDFIDRLCRIDHKDNNTGNAKITDFSIFGIRGNAISNVICETGNALTLRKHNEKPITLEKCVSQNVLSWEIADMIGMFIKGETNIVVAGITGSGKTTTMRALLDHYIPPLNKRTLVLEDTPELFLKNAHTLALHTLKTGDDNTSIDLRKLIITALRLKPKYIVVGEVRGAEAEAAVEGMETGHSTIFSMHAGEPVDAVNRLVTKYLMQMPSLGQDVVERIIGSAVNFIVIQDDILGIGRKVTSVHEITYDTDTRRVKITPIVTYDFFKKDWVFSNMVTEGVQNTMLRRGVTTEEISQLKEMIESHIKSDKKEASD